MIKLIIAGSRTVSPTLADIDRAVRSFVENELGLEIDDYDNHGGAKSYVDEVISGHANGADMAGEECGKARDIHVHREPVTAEDYAMHGRYLGPKMRNRRMAERGTHALIFWDGTSGGSADMCTRMVARGKPVEIVPYKATVTRKAKS